MFVKIVFLWPEISFLAGKIGVLFFGAGMDLWIGGKPMLNGLK
jgi:hypothetical protein